MPELESHQYFSAHCFNEVWRLLEKEDRSKAESLLMRDAAHASLYHWKQREDCQPQNLSIGLWMLARIYAVLGKGEEAMEYAAACIEISEAESLAPFYIGYAFEVAARAARAAREQGDEAKFSEYFSRATEHKDRVEDDEDRALLESDLTELEA